MGCIRHRSIRHRSIRACDVHIHVHYILSCVKAITAILKLGICSSSVAVRLLSLGIIGRRRIMSKVDGRCSTLYGRFANRSDGRGRCGSSYFHVYV